MRDYRRSSAFTSDRFRSNQFTDKDDNMSDPLSQILGAIEALKESIKESNEKIAQTLFDIQREQLNVRRELVSIQRDELNLEREKMNLRVDAVKSMKELAKSDDMEFLKNLDDNEDSYVRKAIERAKEIEEMNRANIFK